MNYSLHIALNLNHKAWKNNEDHIQCGFLSIDSIDSTGFRASHVLYAWHIANWKCGKSFRDRWWHKAFQLLLEFLDLRSLWKHRANHFILISGRTASLGGTNLEKQVKNLIINPSILNLVSVLAWRGNTWTQENQVSFTGVQDQRTE